MKPIDESNEVDSRESNAGRAYNRLSLVAIDESGIN